MSLKTIMIATTINGLLGFLLSPNKEKWHALIIFSMLTAILMTGIAAACDWHGLNHIEQQTAKLGLIVGLFLETIMYFTILHSIDDDITYPLLTPSALFVIVLSACVGMFGGSMLGWGIGHCLSAIRIL